MFFSTYLGIPTKMASFTMITQNFVALFLDFAISFFCANKIKGLAYIRLYKNVTSYLI